jgi:hypothetical protein
LLEGNSRAVLSRLFTEKLKESLAEVSNITLVLDRIRNFARKSSEKIATATKLDLEVICVKMMDLFNDITKQERIALHLRDLEKLPHLFQRPAYN